MRARPEPPAGARERIVPRRGPAPKLVVPPWAIAVAVALVLGAFLRPSCGAGWPAGQGADPTPISTPKTFTEAEVRAIAAKAAADALAAERARRQEGVCDDPGAALLAKVAAGCPGYEKGIPCEELPFMYRPEGGCHGAREGVRCEDLSYQERVKRGCAGGAE